MFSGYSNDNPSLSLVHRLRYEDHQMVQAAKCRYEITLINKKIAEIEKKIEVKNRGL